MSEDYSGIDTVCPTILQSPIILPMRTAILVKTIKHAAELASLLPTWPVVTSSSCYLAGLDRERAALLRRRCSTPIEQHNCIATIDGFARVRMRPFDALIWAAGGTHLPALPANQLICRGNSHSRLLYIDCDDQHHAHLRREKEKRREAYWSAGWFPIGMPPIVGRIRRFLSHRPGGGP